MHEKFEINRTKIKSDSQSGRKVVPHDSKSDLPLGPGTKAYKAYFLKILNSNCVFLFMKILEEANHSLLVTTFLPD